ncbi:class I SAM-dependent methyltransferase [Legionella parisiensis]|uniref:Glycine/sarcosine N-methyltransferase n=1 Tax=Legionella parisiensis TaxID=45071 RepID=A0A1E5JLJ9_9GAMM|nr:class I SAM-dependent methyltransferase [Legionella parisiensis]KTD41612.1 methyltransferase [Legionella parisiensis]OEH45415.1 Glycine/sarcosine N-methyltransferase [Legionella parisiensis]STX76070.1 methyltransferase [Legionella parisiensis]
MKKSNKNKVYEAYDELIDWFDVHRNKELHMEQFYLYQIKKHFPHGGSVLDIGCGTGEPIAKFFIQAGYDITGVDASTKMIERCKQNFPNAHWIIEDMRTMKFLVQFDIVIAWHSFFHLPQADQRSALSLFSSLVKPKGLLLFTSGPEAGEVWGENGDYDLYHASLDAKEYTTILNKNHLQVLVHKVSDPNCGGATVWLAQKS